MVRYSQMQHKLTNRSTSTLKEPKQKVHRNDEEVSKRNTEPKKVIPKWNVDQKETDSTPKQSDGQNSSGVKGITQLSRDDVSSGVGTHEDGVHLW